MSRGSASGFASSLAFLASLSSALVSGFLAETLSSAVGSGTIFKSYGMASPPDMERR